MRAARYRTGAPSRPIRAAPRGASVAHEALAIGQRLASGSGHSRPKRVLTNPTSANPTSANPTYANPTYASRSGHSVPKRVLTRTLPSRRARDGAMVNLEALPMRDIFDHADPEF